MIIFKCLSSSLQCVRKAVPAEADESGPSFHSVCNSPENYGHISASCQTLPMKKAKGFKSVCRGISFSYVVPTFREGTCQKSTQGLPGW